jgi:hypothetical protein
MGTSIVVGRGNYVIMTVGRLTTTPQAHRPLKSER